MFFGTEKIKIKKFYAVCDVIASDPLCTRIFIKDATGLSYPTVSNTVEGLLDMDMIAEHGSTKGFAYSFNKKYCIAVADLRGGSVMYFTDLGGHELYRVNHRESDAFFYDEKLSLFFRDTSVLFGRKFPKSKLLGVCVILPSAAEAYRGTRSILSSNKRLTDLVSSYFNTSEVKAVTAADAVSSMHEDERALIVMKEPCGVICRAVGYGCTGTGILKSVGTTSIGRCDTSEQLALEIACAIGNLCDVLKPETVYVDGDRMFSVSAFPRRLRAALASFNCTDESSLPNIRHTDGGLAISAGARIIRCSHIERKIREEKERTI